MIEYFFYSFMYAYSVTACKQVHRHKKKFLLPNQKNYDNQFVDKERKTVQCKYCPKQINHFLIKSHILAQHYNEVSDIGKSVLASA